MKEQSISPAIQQRRFRANLRGFREAVRLVVAETLPRLGQRTALLPSTHEDDYYYRAERNLLIGLCVLIAEKELKGLSCLPRHRHTQRVLNNLVLKSVTRREARVRLKSLQSRAIRILRRESVKHCIAEVFERVLKSSADVPQTHDYYLDHTTWRRKVRRVMNRCLKNAA